MLHVRRRHWPLAAAIMHRSLGNSSRWIFPVHQRARQPNTTVSYQGLITDSLSNRHVQARKPLSHRADGAENTSDFTYRWAELVSNHDRELRSGIKHLERHDDR